MELLVPAVAEITHLPVVIEKAGQVIASQNVVLKPARRIAVHILPHSHTDIGYTEIQTAIEKKQVQNLIDGMAAAKSTADYPEGARFVWNVEVLWAADLFLKRLDETQRAAFIAAVKSGQVELNGMYLNQLTGLCRPEELLRLFRHATQLAELTGVPIDSAMISDVPGCTWGTVTAMNQAGIRYLSNAPNYFDRIGTILSEWENKPFWWLGPDGVSKVLVWIPYQGYALSHLNRRMSAELVDRFHDKLDEGNYPYEIAYLRWSGIGDNAVPDPSICGFVNEWNAKYDWPRFVISGTSKAFRALEERYGDELPVVRGDWTPYWEDGAGSSARETAMNRNSADRLSQAEALFAMRMPQDYPAADFQEAWNHVMLYSEHTWGADCSVSEPESEKTREQWQIKQSYARQAERQSRELLERALEAGGPAVAGSWDVINTLAWPRSEIVVLDAVQSTAGDRVVDESGAPVPSQRFKTGGLAFLASEVPPFAGRRFTVTAGEAHVAARATAEGLVLDSGIVRVQVDGKTGGIQQLSINGMEHNLVDTRDGGMLNDYLYFIGGDPAAAQRNGLVEISVGESGPLVASLVIESAAPGCKRLRRELRTVAGGDFIEIHNLVDKARIAAPDYDKASAKESLSFGFPFHVPGGEMKLDLPLASMRPEADQIPSSCKNWFSIGRWADVSNSNYGVTWVTLDAPLVQIGELSANLIAFRNPPEVWRKTVEPTQKIYPWVMNNHWRTNYRAYQEGETMFRFVLRPHRAPDAAAATRFATGFTKPLLVRPAAGAVPVPLLRLDSATATVLTLKPADDGKALIVRLFGSSGEPGKARLIWTQAPKNTWLSDTGEQALQPAPETIDVPPWGIVTLRAEW